jgi:hypothetical protein
MRILAAVAATLQAALGPALDPIARSTGAVRRRRKFAGASLLQTVVLTLLKSPAAKADDFVATAVPLGVTVTPQAVEKRFTAPLVAFLRAALGHVLRHAVAAEAAAVPLLEKFTAVEIGDSTTVTVPDDYAAEFPGCGGKSGSGRAAVKIQLRWDLRSGRLAILDLQPGRHSDAHSEVPEPPARRGSLIVRDPGFFSLERFGRWAADGVSWISRLQPGTAAFDADGRPLELLRWLQRHAGSRPVDRPIVLGAAERLGCRLIALRVPPEVAARRRQKAYQRASKHGTVPGAEQLAWCDWTILVTDCPPELLTWREVVVLYRARWQIELIFKLWKSHNHLAAYRSTWTAVERMAVFWAKLIGAVVQHWLVLASVGTDPRRSHWKAAGVIREWVVTLARALGDGGALIGVLADLAKAIEAVAKKKRQGKSPSTFQLLLDPELLNWNR